MDINVLFDEGYEGCLDADRLRAIARAVLDAEEADANAELGVLITGQERIRELNTAHLGEDRPTDVLSFPMLPGTAEADSGDFVTPPDGAVHLGEVIISYPQAVIQAEENAYPVEKEVAILLIHGVFHLLGYDHDAPEPEARMKSMEALVLGRVQEAGR
jgi:probable rRNA maturation factor